MSQTRHSVNRQRENSIPSTNKVCREYKLISTILCMQGIYKEGLQV